MVAAVSVGIVNGAKRSAIWNMLKIPPRETDMNVVMTEDGRIIEVQNLPRRRAVQP